MHCELFDVSRRVHQRFSVPEPRRLTVTVSRLGGPEQTCEVVDISRGGTRIRSQLAFYKGDCVWVRMHWPESPQTVLGEVQRVSTSGDDLLVAIEFDTPLTHLAEACATWTD